MKFYGDEVIAPNGNRIPLTPAVETEGLIFLSGVLGLVNGKAVEGIEEQTQVVFDAISATLMQAGLSLKNVIKTTVWLTASTDFPGFNAVYSKNLSPPFPARSCVVSQLLVPGARVEVEVVASRNDERI